MGPRDVLIIAWIRGNARTEDLGSWLGAEILFMPWAWPGLPLPRRLASWLRSAVATVRAVRGGRPATIVVVEPPVFAPLCAWAVRRRGSRIFLDLHSGALIAPNWAWARPLLGFVARRVHGVIVTNRETLQGLDLGATPSYVLHDPIWARPGSGPRAGGAATPPYVLFPASANPDEPLRLVEEVGRLLGGDPRVKVSGGLARPDSAGVEYLGYLPRPEYDRLLAGASAVLALTDWEATMQRSAYEAVQAAVPVVALDRRVLRETMDGGGCVFASADPDEIARAIRYAVANREELSGLTARSRERFRAGSGVV